MKDRKLIINEFREAINSLPKVPKGSPWDFFIKDAKARFKIAEGFLLSSPDLLIADDCCGRGLPSFQYASASRTWGFVMNKSLEARISEVNYLRTSALGMGEKPCL